MTESLTVKAQRIPALVVVLWPMGTSLIYILLCFIAMLGKVWPLRESLYLTPFVAAGMMVFSFAISLYWFFGACRVNYHVSADDLYVTRGQRELCRIPRVAIRDIEIWGKTSIFSFLFPSIGIPDLPRLKVKIRSSSSLDGLLLPEIYFGNDRRARREFEKITTYLGLESN